MSNLGEWDSVDDEDTGDELAVPAPGPSSTLTTAVTAALASADLTAMLEAAARKAVQRRVDTIVAEAVQAVVDEDTDALARLRTAAEESVTAALSAAAQQDDAALYYPTLQAFVAEQLAPMYRRDLEGRTRVWCPQWWRHAEAIARLEALWRAWEHLRLDPATGISVWFRDHADHHMAVLLDPEGPFKRCAKGHGERLKPLPIDAPPEGMFQEDQ